ncbi:MAG: efflux RND transporter periplasmic adaptor subunit [Bacteroidia bacterium]
MNRILNITLILSLAIGLAACGGGPQGEDLGSKRKELEKLKGEKVTLDEKIATLEKTISKLDTTKREVAPIPVQVTALATGGIKHFLEIQGSVESNRNVMVSPKMGGIYTSIKAKEGQYVSAGSTLATVDDALLRASRAELETQISLLKTLYEKQQRLWDQEIGTEVQLLQAKNNYEALQKRLGSIDEQIAMARVKAPISGSVDKVVPKIGEMATPGMPAFQIISQSDLSLKAKVSESYAATIKLKDAVKIYFPAIDKSYTARITNVGKSIDPTSRTFEVEARLPADKQIKINMYGKMAINDQNLKDIIVTPVEVLQKGAKGNYVYIAAEDGGKWYARRREVETGLSYEGNAEITTGLKAGDRLIIEGFKELSDGQLITF